jgi:hypothetical protein
MIKKYITDRKMEVNPNGTTMEEGAYLGTFGETIIGDSCQPLFHLNDLGGKNLSEVQKRIQTFFNDVGKRPR